MQRRGDGAARTYLFKHALVQEVAYETLLKSERQRHHLAIAEAMEAASDPVAYSPEMLAHHFADAGLPERAVPYGISAGLRAIEQSANREAVAHLLTCLDLLQTLPGLRGAGPARADGARAPGGPADGDPRLRLGRGGGRLPTGP